MGLPKAHRLGASEIRSVLADGRRAAAGPLLLRWRPREAGPLRLAVRAAGARRAVDRSLLRRRVCEALRETLSERPSADLVLTWRLAGAVPDRDEILERFESAARRLA